MDRAPGLSVRLKLTLSYAGFVMVAGAVLLAAVWVFLLHDLPDVAVSAGGIVPIHSIFRRDFAPIAAIVRLWRSREIPWGELRVKIGSPPLRSGTPW